MLTNSKISQIESLTQDVLLTVYKDSTDVIPPINILEIVKHYGISLQTATFKDSSVSGAFEKATKSIFVSPDDSYVRKSFTIAHELGHLLLHQEKPSELFFRTDSSKLTEEDRIDEQEANWFAASLLMPEYLISQYIQITSDVHELSTIFGVSPMTAYFRLKNLKYIE